MCILHASSVCSQSVKSVPPVCCHGEQCVCSFRPQDDVRLHLSGKPDPGGPLLTAQDSLYQRFKAGAPAFALHPVWLAGGFFVCAVAHVETRRQPQVFFVPPVPFTS